MGKSKKKTPPQKKELKISACMMVKNEEEMLERCLASINHLVDEIIVVDTGSTDRTVEIAESFGAKIFHHPWEQNFSKHRNQSLSYATGDWLITIDADEELDAQHLTKKELKKRFQEISPKVHCLLIRMLDKNQQGIIISDTKILRIFRNRVGVEFQGIVHNAPHYTGLVADFDLNYFHYGYALSEEQMQAKFKRTSSLLHKRIENDPYDFQAYFYLCQVYMQMKERRKGIEYAHQCLDKLPSQKDTTIDISFYHSLYHTITMGHIGLTEYDIAIATVRKGLELLPDEIDLYYDLAYIGSLSNNFNLIIEGSENYLRVLEEFRNIPMRASTRFLFSTSKEIQTTLEYWLMTAYLATNNIDHFHGLWNQNQNQLINKPSHLKQLLTNLELSETSTILETVIVSIFEHRKKCTPAIQKLLLEHAIFFAKKNSEEAPLETSITEYLDLITDYKEIPTDTTVIIAEFLLKKGMGDFFLDITLVLFEKLLINEIETVNGTADTAKGYGLIADKQARTEKGVLTASICLNIAWCLTEDNTYLTRRDNLQEKKVSTRKIGQNVGTFNKTTDAGFGESHTGRSKMIHSKPPLVSIGLPVYNGGEDLNKAIESILNQDFENFELLISDNCSTDSTENICRNHANRDSRIHYVRLDKNYGMVTNWHNVAGFAKGEFFMFAQHDNTHFPNFLSTCLNEFNEHEDDSLLVVFPQINIFDGANTYTPYADPINAIHNDPIERYLHILWKLDLNNALLGMMRTSTIKTNKIFFGTLSSRGLFADQPMMSEIALQGKLKRIDKILLNRKMSPYKKPSTMEQRTTSLISAVGSYVMNDGITLPYIGIIRRQMEVINYSAISFSKKDFLINETIKCLKHRFGPQMVQEINRAVALVKKNTFYYTWDGRNLPEATLNELEHFKHFYMTGLCRELEDALFVYPELDELRETVEICRNHSGGLNGRMVERQANGIVEGV